MDYVLEPANLRASLKKVKANKGAPGVDGIGTEELEAHLEAHGKTIESKLRAGSCTCARLASFDSCVSIRMVRSTPLNSSAGVVWPSAITTAASPRLSEDSVKPRARQPAAFGA